MAAWRFAVARLVLCLHWAAPACAQPVVTAVATPVALITEAKGAFRILARGHPAPSEVTSPVELGAIREDHRAEFCAVDAAGRIGNRRTEFLNDFCVGSLAGFD